MELAYRLAIEESPFIQTIRNNIIFVFTPATRSGRPREAGRQLRRAAEAGCRRPSMVYWGKYVQHDNNRDGIGVGLRLTQDMLKTFLDWHPQVWHDLHESVTLLYTSTGTGPYNAIVDPIQINEWWLLAQTEIMEMTKRGVPGVWTYNYYDGWVPNYMFWIGVTHNSIGRFYETQSYGGAVNRPLPVQQSREWYRPNPTPPDMMWGPRNNVNMQQSALLIAMNSVAKNKETFLENYYLKNKHTIERGQDARRRTPTSIPAKQRRRVEAAELMNLIRREGAEVHTANAAFTHRQRRRSRAGDYIVRLDQPYGGDRRDAARRAVLSRRRTRVRTTTPAGRSRWCATSRRSAIDDKAIFEQADDAGDRGLQDSPAPSPAPGRVLIVDHTTDNTLVTFRFQHAGVKMSAAEQEFEAGGHKFAPGAFVIAERRTAPRSSRSIKRARPVGLGRRRRAGRADARPRRAADRLHPHLDEHAGRRLGPPGVRQVQGAVHLLRRAEAARRATCARSTTSSSSRMPGRAGPALITGGVQGNEPRPYKKTDADAATSASIDSTDDMRGGLGIEGLQELLQVRASRAACSSPKAARRRSSPSTT